MKDLSILIPPLFGNLPFPIGAYITIVVSGEVFCDSLHAHILFHHHDNLFQIGPVFVEPAFERSIRWRSHVPKKEYDQQQNHKNKAANSSEQYSDDAPHLPDSISGDSELTESCDDWRAI
jgi:hypothetical protein